MLYIFLYLTGMYFIFRLVFYCLKPKKITIRKHKLPEKPIQQPPPTKTSSLCPFLLYNGLKITSTARTFTIPKGTEIFKNYVILDGIVDLLYKGKKITSRTENEITCTPFDLLGISTGVVKRATTDLLVYEPPENTSNYVNMKYLERLVIHPMLTFCKEITAFVLMETFKAPKFENFLLKNFKLVDYEPEMVVAGVDFVLGEYLHYVVSGSLLINGILFEKESIFGYFGAFFNGYTGFSCIAKEGTILKRVPYSKLKNSIFDVRILKHVPYSFLLMGITAKWTIAKQLSCIYTKDTIPDCIYLIDGLCHCCKECVLSSPLDHNLVTDKMVDVVEIPKSTIDTLVTLIPHFYKELTKKMFEKQAYKSKIVLILPTKEDYETFYKRLATTLLNDAVILTSKSISEILNKNLFNVVEELVLSETLKKAAETTKVVIVFLENKYSRLVHIIQQFCDIVFVVGDVTTHNRFPGSNVELISLYETRRVKKQKPAVKIKTNIFSSLFSPRMFEESSSSDDEQLNDHIAVNPLVPANNRKMHKFRRVHAIMSPKATTFCTKDYERFGRYLKGERFGLVLGGGGARGYAHIGVIKALEEENIPIDLIGGTSMGALIGALYARELDYMEVYRHSKKMAKLGSSFFYFLIDFTYPFISLLSGRTMKASLKSVLKDQQIQNFWLEYFCVATDLISLNEKVFFNGSAYKTVRASMSVAGLVPPVFYKDMVLCDGAYANNVPVDVMRRMEVKNIITVKVEREFSKDIDKTDSKSGIVLFLKSIFQKKNYLTLPETQYRLSFLNDTYKQKNLGENDFLLQPDLSQYQVLDFHKFEEIVAIGYLSAKTNIRRWKQMGKISEFKKTFRRFTL